MRADAATRCSRAVGGAHGVEPDASPLRIVHHVGAYATGKGYEVDLWTLNIADTEQFVDDAKISTYERDPTEFGRGQRRRNIGL